MSKVILIDGVQYAPVNKSVENEDGLTCCVIRSTNAGVFYGYVKERNGDAVTLINSRRIWRWYGAASLSQLSQEGVKQPDDCKIAMAEPEKIVFGVIEITPITEAAKKNLDEVPEWKN